MNKVNNILLIYYFKVDNEKYILKDCYFEDNNNTVTNMSCTVEGFKTQMILPSVFK